MARAAPSSSGGSGSTTTGARSPIPTGTRCSTRSPTRSWGRAPSPISESCSPTTAGDNESRDSADFLLAALAAARDAGYAPSNLDATVVLERPKLKDRKREIRANLARLLGLPLDRVNVKGKTHERVDAVGEGRAVEVHAAVLMTITR
jgi:2C-methyl-D-erythritol 2,4-cyclodiphosphate synthase